MNWTAILLILKIVAWVGAIVSISKFGLRLYFSISYVNSQEEAADQAQGYKRVWRLWPPVVYLILCVLIIAGLWGR